MDFISIENHENTRLENVDFQFKCFHINNYDTPPHWHNHREIIYINKGRCSIYLNGTLLLCNEGDLVFVPHGSLHSINCDNSADYFAIVIGDTLFASMMTDIHCNGLLHPFFSENTIEPWHIDKTQAEYSRLFAPINSIINEEENRQVWYEMIIKIELCRFFAQLVRDFPEILSSQSNQQNMTTIKMKNVIEYIFVHYSEKITISLMAEFSHMSNQHFCRLFKAYTGKTFINYLTDYRLEQSNILLKTTDLPITRIPELTGFCNGNYFARIYRNRYGHAPSYTRKILI